VKTFFFDVAISVKGNLYFWSIFYDFWK